MNILYCTNYFSNSVGGSEYVFWLYVKYMAEHGHNVYVVCFNGDTQALERLRNASSNVQVIALTPEVKLMPYLPRKVFINIKYVVKGLKEINHILRSEDIDLIHTNVYIPVVLGSIIKKRYKIPHITTVHDVRSAMGLLFLYRTFYEVERSPIIALSKSALCKEGERMLFSYTCIDAILAPSNKTARDLNRLLGSRGYSKNVYIIPNAIDIMDYQDPTVHEDELLEETILYIGRLTFYKNLDTAIRAFALLRREYPSAKLIIAGDGPARQNYQELVRKLSLGKHVKFLNSVSHRRKLELIANSRFLINPSIFEGFGLVILEAWALRKPVIVSRISPLKDIVEDSIDGLTVPPLNVRAWYDAMSLLMEDNSLIKDMGQHGFNKVLKYYDYKRTYALLEQLYKRYSMR